MTDPAGSMPTVTSDDVERDPAPVVEEPSATAPPKRRARRTFAMAFIVALLGFGGGIAGFFAADEWLQDDDVVETATSSRATTAQPSNDVPDATTRVSNASGDLTPGEIYRRVAPAVVHIESEVTTTEQGLFGLPEERESTGTGSGFVIDTDGYIVTNAHVVDGASKLSVSFGDDATVSAKLIGEDTSTDIAVIKIDPDAKELGGKLRTVEFGDSTRLQVGDPVLAIGNPFSLDRTLTTGVISALQRQIPALNEGYEIADVIQTDAAVNPGNSGGPLLDVTGKVIGVNSQIQTKSGGFDGIAFAVPASTARDIAEQLIDTGSVDHAWLGLAGGELTPELADALNLPVKEGVLVGSVNEGSPADKAGIEGGASDMVIEGTSVHPGGDVLLKFNGEKLTTMRQLAGLVDGMKPGDEAEVEFLQDGKKKTATVKLATRPENAQDEE